MSYVKCICGARYHDTKHECPDCSMDNPNIPDEDYYIDLDDLIDQEDYLNDNEE